MQNNNYQGLFVKNNMFIILIFLYLWPKSASLTKFPT